MPDALACQKDARTGSCSAVHYIAATQRVLATVPVAAAALIWISHHEHHWVFSLKGGRT